MENINEKILKIINDYILAFNEHDLEKVYSFLDDKCISTLKVTGKNDIIYNTDAVKQAYINDFKSKDAKAEVIMSPKIVDEIDGNYAIEAILFATLHKKKVYITYVLNKKNLKQINQIITKVE